MDINFNTTDDGLTGDGFDLPVQTLSLQPDQNLIVGGEFLNLNGVPVPFLTRLKPDGSVDETFNTGIGFNGKIYASYVQPDGKIVVGGNFTSFNGINAGRIIRLNYDGTYDASFNSTLAATSGIIYEITPQSDGKIIITGSFTKYNNVTVNRIARLMSDGSLDTSFVTGSGSSSNIMYAKVLPDGRILVAGNFTTFNNISSNKMICLNPDGSRNTDFSSGSGFDDDVTSMILQPDGKIIIGGKFTSYNGSLANRIIRINNDGSVDPNFFSGSGFNSGVVQAIKINLKGEIMVGGSFTGNYNGEAVNRVCLLNSDGRLLDTIDFGTGPGSASVLALENDLEDSWYIGGSFSVFDGLNQGRLAKINTEKEYDTSYLSAGVGFDNSIYKVLPLENRKMIVCGNFKKFNGEFASRITKLLEDGTLDYSFNNGQSGANNLVKAAALQADGKVIIGGNFTKYNDTNINRIVRVLENGAIDPTFNIGSGCNSQIYAMAIQADQRILVAGNFTRYNDLPVGRIIRLLPNGTIDTSFDVGSGADAIIESILIEPNGKIVIGGRFTTFNGMEAVHLVRLNANGSIDSGFNIGKGFDKNTYAMALQSDGKIIVGGNFLSFNGIPQKRILRLNPNGQLDTSFNSGSGFNKGDVRTILIQPDDRILVGGTFSGTYNNRPSLRLLRLMKSGSYDDTFDAHLNNKLFTMDFTSDNRLIIGGDFNSVSGISKHRIARLKLCLDATIWNGTSWSNGFPFGGKEVFFTADYSSLTSADICSCTIEEGKNVTLLSGNTLGIEFSYQGSGILTIEDSASLYQTDDDMINTGIVHLKRNTTPLLRYDYTFWSSPVGNQKLVDFSPNTLADKYFSYDFHIEKWRQEKPSSEMKIGTGYIIRAPQYFSITDRSMFEGTFKGIPNNGKIQVKQGMPDKSNLIGNPYPSTLNADAFLRKNASVLKGALHFWTHNTPITNLEYTTDDYATYNLLGGVGTRASLSIGETTQIPDGKIASGQAFFVVGKSSEDIEFNNSMRSTDSNSFFFKSVNKEERKHNITTEKHRIWLNFENKTGVFKQILIGYIQGATDLFDDQYDAESLNGNPYADFYSIIENKQMVIQGRGLPFDMSDTIFLGFTTTIGGDFTISIDHEDGLFNTQDIFIEDKDLKIMYNLKNAPYSFKTQKGTYDNRFVLRYTDNTLATNNLDSKANAILVSLHNQMIKIDAGKEVIKEIMIFDMSGKLLYQKNKIKDSGFSIQSNQFHHQVLLIKITTENGKTTTQKIVF
ncbi:delta-60 repeat domain-containing protein [Flavobacterium branchiicola]|nr:delta-60 repeat domain-containing protein [Flavobacterium branchiicola]